MEVWGSPFDAYTGTGNRRAFGSAKLLVPVVPTTFYTAGIKYEAHARKAAALLGQEPNLPAKADIGYRATMPSSPTKSPSLSPGTRRRRSTTRARLCSGAAARMQKATGSPHFNTHVATREGG